MYRLAYFSWNLTDAIKRINSNNNIRSIFYMSCCPMNSYMIETDFIVIRFVHKIAHRYVKIYAVFYC